MTRGRRGAEEGGEVKEREAESLFGTCFLEMKNMFINFFDRKVF